MIRDFNLIKVLMVESELSQLCPTLWDPMDSSLHQASPSTGFSRQEYWSGLPFPSGNLLDPGIQPRSPTRQAYSLPSEPLVSGVLHSDLGCPGGSDKKSACHARDIGSIPGSQRSPGKGNGYPLQYSCLENSMDCLCTSAYSRPFI